MTNNTKAYKSFKDKVEKYEKIFIFRKDNPDADAYGSQLGLKEILKINYPDKKVYALGENSEYLNPVGRMDDIDESMLTGGLAIIVDCPSTKWVDHDEWKNCAEVIKIDDHPEKEQYGTLQLTDTSMPTCSELIADIAFSLKWRITPDAAQSLLIGILDGTAYFRTSTVTKHTFIILGKLIEISPDVKDIFGRNQLTTTGEVKLKRFMMNKTKTTDNGTTYLFIPNKILKKFEVDPNRASTFIWILMDISQGEFTVMFTEYEDKKVRIQFRSRTRPVNLFAAKYGGWGTPNSAGAFLVNKKQIKEVLQLLDNEIV